MSLRPIRLRHVETFVEIARRASLKAAAEHLNLTQPAVSRSLKELEEALGARLLERGRGGVQVTPEGAVFLQYADAGMASLARAVQAVASGGGQGRISVGALPSVAARVLPQAVSRFAGLAPQVTAMIEEGPHIYLMDRLRARALDLVVGRLGLPDTMKGVSFTQLYMEHVVIVAAPGHPMARTAHLGDLAGHRIIYPSPEAAIRPLVDRLFVAHGLDPDLHRIEAVSDSFGRAMALEGGMLWLISQGVVAADLAEGRLVALPLDMGLTAGPVGIMARAEEDAAAPVRLFRQAITATVAALDLR